MLSLINRNTFTMKKHPEKPYTMKKAFYTLALAAGTILAGCQTPAQKEEAAQVKVNEANQDLKDAKLELDAEYPDFRKNAEAQINANDSLITALRIKQDQSGAAPASGERKQKIDDLEKANVELRSRLYGYETQRTSWLDFKREFNRDKDKLSQAVHDFGEDLKK
jgi:hypothetical protein